MWKSWRDDGKGGWGVETEGEGDSRERGMYGDEGEVWEKRGSDKVEGRDGVVKQKSRDEEMDKGGRGMKKREKMCGEEEIQKKEREGGRIIGRKYGEEEMMREKRGKK